MWVVNSMTKSRSGEGGVWEDFMELVACELRNEAQQHLNTGRQNKLDIQARGSSA